MDVDINLGGIELGTAVGRPEQIRIYFELGIYAGNSTKSFQDGSYGDGFAEGNVVCLAWFPTLEEQSIGTDDVADIEELAFAVEITNAQF